MSLPSQVTGQRGTSSLTVASLAADRSKELFGSRCSLGASPESEGQGDRAQCCRDKILSMEQYRASPQRWGLTLYFVRERQAAVFDGLQLGEIQSGLVENSFTVFTHV